MAKKVKVALIYDFDGTLSTTDMQNYGLIPTFGMSCKTFWNKANTFGDQNMMEQITSSMYYVFKTAKDKKIPLTRELFFECGKNIQFFEGVENWFERINHYGDMLDLEIEHYVISAGYEEIIEGCAIRKYFKEVYGCAYAYDDKGEAVWAGAGWSTIPPKPSTCPKSTKVSASSTTAGSTNLCPTKKGRSPLPG